MMVGFQDGRKNWLPLRADLKADSHELLLTCAAAAEGCKQKIEKFLSQLWQHKPLLQLHVSNAACVNQP